MGYIDEKTAQLILDALAWSNMDWMDSLEWNYTESDQISLAQGDFVRFCKARGIDGVERTVHIKGPVKGWVDDED